MWNISKALHVPLDRSIEFLKDIPHTISFIIRKRQQIDNLNELPKDKRPPEDIIWDGASEELEEWLDNIFGSKKGDNNLELVVKDIEE